MGHADHGPFGTNFLDAAQQKLAEASGLFDLPEHRLDDLFWLF
jgi:putative transposase